MSYFTTQEVISRVNNNVRTQANEYLKARNKTEVKRIQKNTDVRWSELLCLPYFDIVKMVTVDPMHTIFGDDKA